MPIFKIKDYITRYNDYVRAGDSFFNDAKQYIDNSQIIVFDMEGIDAVSTVFLNTTLGHLMDDYGTDKVKQSLRFVNILRTQADRIRRYISDYEDLHKVGPVKV